MKNNQLTIITSHYKDLEGLLTTWKSIKIKLIKDGNGL